MPKHIDLEQRSPEWHTWRNTHITASNAGAILGLNKFKTPLKLYLEHVQATKDCDNKYMKHGRETEAEALQWLYDQTGVVYTPSCFESSQLPWMGASLDGWNEEQKKGAEIKCPMRCLADIKDLHTVPEDHYAQMQHQMCVMEEQEWLYIVYSKEDKNGVIIHVKRDDAFIEDMIEKERDFNRRIHDYDPPPHKREDYNEITDQEVIERANQLHAVKQQIKSLEKQEKELCAILKEDCEKQSSILGNLEYEKILYRGNVDYSKIPELQGVDLTPYRKAGSERWTLKEIKK